MWSTSPSLLYSRAINRRTARRDMWLQTRGFKHVASNIWLQTCHPLSNGSKGRGTRGTESRPKTIARCLEKQAQNGIVIKSDKKHSRTRGPVGLFHLVLLGGDVEFAQKQRTSFEHYVYATTVLCEVHVKGPTPHTSRQNVDTACFTCSCIPTPYASCCLLHERDVPTSYDYGLKYRDRFIINMKINWLLCSCPKWYIRMFEAAETLIARTT